MSDLLGVTESSAKPTLRCLTLVGRTREETGFKAYLCLMGTFWIFNYTLPGIFLYLIGFTEHAVIENFLHITGMNTSRHFKVSEKSGNVTFRLPQSFIRIFSSTR